ncbi:MAG: sulfur carrier protein ThiS [Elusimicrobia bacterium]|nr:sulfur carrier protein ThiS [Elusimicrobiota bacterium]
MIKVNGNAVTWRDGMTVADALAAMNYDFGHITVTVDGRHVPQDDFDTTPVPDGADMKAIHLHHGG